MVVLLRGDVVSDLEQKFNAMIQKPILRYIHVTEWKSIICVQEVLPGKMQYYKVMSAV
ncbi:MAG: hypothetical protein JG782_645 [Anaerophaga sp.]|jgi:hypothetical protein|nr:hypothetical protein [Anaerophaga sp.]MDI3521562.1 hypothetical protein [Anaerophaga sp.]